MSPKAKMQPDAFDQLRSTLESQAWSHDALAEYVNAVAQDKTGEEIFRRMAFRKAALEAYEGLHVDDQARLRRWWHDRIQSQAYEYEDLRQRLSWRYMV